MKKSVVLCSALAAVLLTAAVALPAAAASDPADDSSGYSFQTGRQAYESRMAEDHPWYDNEEEAETDDYSFRLGTQSSESRIGAFAEMPTGDDLTDEELNEFFESHGIGTGAAYSDGQYDESAKSSYGYMRGQSAYQERNAAFAGNR